MSAPTTRSAIRTGVQRALVTSPVPSRNEREPVVCSLNDSAACSHSRAWSLGCSRLAAAELDSMNCPLSAMRAAEASLPNGTPIRSLGTRASRLRCHEYRDRRPCAAEGQREGGPVKVYDVVVIGTSREVYRVQADSPEDARRAYEMNGSTDLMSPVVTEIEGTEVESVSLYDEG